MSSREPEETFPSEEASQRFKAALRGAREVGHKPMESLTQKKPKKQSGKKKTTNKK